MGEGLKWYSKGELEKELKKREEEEYRHKRSSLVIGAISKITAYSYSISSIEQSYENGYSSSCNEGGNKDGVPWSLKIYFNE